MLAGLKNAYESIKAFSETDFTEDLKKFDVPTLVLHGEDDQIVPVNDSAVKSAGSSRAPSEIYYPGAAARHGHPSGSGQRRFARVPKAGRSGDRVSSFDSQPLEAATVCAL